MSFYDQYTRDYERCEYAVSPFHVCRRNSDGSTEAKRELLVRYNEVETDSLVVCDGCAKYVRTDAEKRGYTTKTLTRR